jgi:hypothetical protein
MIPVAMPEPESLPATMVTNLEDRFNTEDTASKCIFNPLQERMAIRNHHAASSPIKTQMTCF